jgi:hypothetical protein
MKWILLGIAFIVFNPYGMTAQEIELQPSELVRYDWVRLRAPVVGPAAIVGRVIEVDSAQLVLLNRRDHRLLIPLGEIDHLDVLVGRKRLLPAMLGLVVGAVAGGVAYKLHADAKYDNDEWNGLVALVVGVPIGGLTGAGVGALIGARDWRPVRICPSPGRDGLNGSDLGMREDVSLSSPAGIPGALPSAACPDGTRQSSSVRRLAAARVALRRASGNLSR